MKIVARAILKPDMESTVTLGPSDTHESQFNSCAYDYPGGAGEGVWGMTIEGLNRDS